MKLFTINQIVQAIVDEGEAKAKADAKAVSDANMKRYLEKRAKDMHKRVANEAAIYLKTALICETQGIEKAMGYFMGWHSEDEYAEYLTGVVGPETK